MLLSMWLTPLRRIVEPLDSLMSVSAPPLAEVEDATVCPVPDGLIASPAASEKPAIVSAYVCALSADRLEPEPLFLWSLRPQPSPGASCRNRKGRLMFSAVDLGHQSTLRRDHLNVFDLSGYRRWDCSAGKEPRGTAVRSQLDRSPERSQQAKCGALAAHSRDVLEPGDAGERPSFPKNLSIADPAMGFRPACGLFCLRWFFLRSAHFV